jgi:hypothetical protein
MIGATEPGKLLNRFADEMKVPYFLICPATPTDVEVFLTPNGRIAEPDAVYVNRTKYIGVVTGLQGKHRGIPLLHAVDVSGGWHEVLTTLTIGRFVDVNPVWARKGWRQPLSCSDCRDP